MRHLFPARKIFFSSILFILFSLLFFFHLHGMIDYDEGYILNASLRVVHGEIPYRDFDMVYTPFSFLYTALFLHLFGESVFVGRLGAFVLSVASLIALTGILQLITKKRLLLFLSLFFFVAWGPAHINFPSPTMFSLCFCLYTIWFALLGILRKQKKYFIWAGIMTVLVLLSKQNFGVGIIGLSLVFFLFYFRKQKAFVLSYLFGVGSMFLLIFIYFIFSGSLFPFIQNIDHYTLQKFIQEKTLNTPFLYEGAFGIRIAKLLFYTLPLSLSMIAFFIIRKSHKEFLVIPFFVSIFYLFGIRPETDYIHVVPLLALSCLSLTLIITFVKRFFARWFLVFFLLLTLLGFYTAYFSGYYKWNPSIREQTVFVSNSPRVGVFLTPQKARETKTLVAYVQKQTTRQEKIFVYNYSPLMYFLFDRCNATRYDFLTPNQLSLAQEQNIMTTLGKDVSLVVVHEMAIHDSSALGQFLRKKYRIEKKIGGYYLLRKRNTNVI
jgi:hypothetical protein